MINAWSLAGSVMDGTLDEDYPIMSKCKYEEDQHLSWPRSTLKVHTLPTILVRGQTSKHLISSNQLVMQKHSVDPMQLSI